MKFATLLSVSMLATTSVFGAATAESSNTFGVLRVDSKKAQTIVCVPWVATSATGGQAIKVADIVKTANLTAGDKLYWYNPSGKSYSGWILEENAVTKIKTWTAAQIAKEGADVAAAAGATDQTLARGNAIILVRQNPKDEQDNAVPFFLQGQYSAGAAESTFDAGVFSLAAPGVASASGYDVNTATWKGVQANDKLLFRKADGKNAELFWGGPENKWGVKTLTKADYLAGQREPTWKVCTASERTIPSGCGAWYVNQGESSVSVQW